MSTHLRTGGGVATLAVAVLLSTTACAGLAPGGAAPATPSTTSSADATPTSSASPEATALAPEPDMTAPAGVPAPDAPPTTSGPVEVVPTWSAVDAATGDLQVSAYVTVVEATGSCTLTVTGPEGRTASVGVEAEADAKTTTCGVMSVPASQLARGTWSGTVTYTSPTSAGSATVPPVDVP
ncbi:hypothetical protein ACFUMH_13640 [Cellulomonas sp. NPDC057328]|uniref:hypothetical protein n=1 Tax=Cellulomonas sp. NPDC057328 TaxID=3346101 RepID=UPI00362BFBDE